LDTTDNTSDWLRSCPEKTFITNVNILRKCHLQRSSFILRKYHRLGKHAGIKEPVEKLLFPKTTVVKTMKGADDKSLHVRDDGMEYGFIILNKTFCIFSVSFIDLST